MAHKWCSIQGLALAIVTVVYVLIGAAIFNALEASDETSNRQVAVDVLQGFIDNNTCLDTEEVLRFVAQINDLKEKGVTISNRTEATHWNYPNAVFFALTVVTTIGYGNISPTNDSSRAFCLVFAIIGIPLFLVGLAKIGATISALISLMVDKCALNYTPKKKYTLRLVFLVLIGSVLLIFIPSAIFMYSDGWSYFIAFYATLISLSTVGFGDYVPGASIDSTMVSMRILHCVWISIGLAWFSSIISTIQEMMTDKMDHMGQNVDQSQKEQSMEMYENGASTNGIKDEKSVSNQALESGPYCEHVAHL